jgi:hypothetical protein
MNGREKIEAAFSPQGTPEIPAVICYEGIYIRDHWEQVSGYPWWYSQSPHLQHQFAWRSQAIASIGQDWFDLPECLPSSLRENRVVESVGEDIYIADNETSARAKLIRPVIGGWKSNDPVNSIHPEKVPSSPADIDLLLPPAQNFDAERFRGQGRSDLADLLLSKAGSGHYPIYHVAAPLWGCYGIWGFEEMMMMVAANPSLVRYASRRNLEICLNEIHRAAALGAEGIWIEDCMVDMISPASYQEINLPLIQAMVEEIGALDMHSIYYFCGNPKGKLGLILESGADAIALEESKKGFAIDILQVAKYIDGRCALFGNLDAIQLLPDASQQELSDALSYQIEAGWYNKGRFIMSVGSPVTPGTTHQQVRQYIELTHQLGRR